MRTPEEIADKACSIQGTTRGYVTSIVAARIAQHELARHLLDLFAKQTRLLEESMAGDEAALEAAGKIEYD